MVLLSASVELFSVSRMRDLFFFFLISGASWWRVCYQRGVPRLVCFLICYKKEKTQIYIYYSVPFFGRFRTAVCWCCTQYPLPTLGKLTPFANDGTFFTLCLPLPTRYSCRNWTFRYPFSTFGLLPLSTLDLYFLVSFTNLGP